MYDYTNRNKVKKIRTYNAIYAKYIKFSGDFTCIWIVMNIYTTIDADYKLILYLFFFSFPFLCRVLYDRSYKNVIMVPPFGDNITAISHVIEKKIL